jgi:F420-non-reducing hydrogenase small subunit
MAKAKIALYWCASCGGCEEAIVDLAEKILDVVDKADIVFWPVALDFKKSDVENYPDKYIDVCFINGAIRFSEHEEMAKLLRRKSKMVIAFGSCSHLGGIPGLANLWNKETIFRYVYHEAPTVVNKEGIEPQEKVKEDGMELELPSFWNTVRALDQVIEVDYYIPGCAPTPKIIEDAINAIFTGQLPEKGSVLASQQALCAECPLNETKPEKITLTEIKRVHQIILDHEKCYLTQGVLCLGPVTRGGCDSLCIKGGMPCTGCFGPLDQTIDQGARAASFITSIIEYEDEELIEKVVNDIVDPIGWFYRYSLPKSILKRRNMEVKKK